MERVIRAIAAGLLFVAILLSAVIYWLFYSNTAPKTAAFDLDLNNLRRAANTYPGPGPRRIEIERLSHTPVPEIAIVAGAGWAKIDMVRASYRLVFPDRSILIDTANSLELAKKFGSQRYDAAAWARMVSAMEKASAIVVTHEHADHIGGLLENADHDAVLAHAVLTKEQVGDTKGVWPLQWPAAAMRHVQPVDYAKLFPLAPGVVLVKAPGHTPGSQMVYVRRADGREFLFMGDTASFLANVTRQKIRSHYVTDYYGQGTHDDRGAVMAQTIALHDLAVRNPELVLVPGHDGQRMLDLIKSGLLTQGFRD